MLRPALSAWLITRLALTLVSLIAVALGLAPDGVAFGSYAADVATHSLTATLHVWWWWDTRWYYVPIALHGYTRPGDPAFFPLYPLLIRLTLPLTGHHPLLAAFIISNAGTLLACVALALLAREYLGARGVPTALLALLCSPFAYFLFAGYNMSLLLASTGFALYAASRRAWGWSALAALLAGLTHPLSLALAPALAWEYCRARRWRAARGAFSTRRWWLQGTLVAGAAPLGLLCFFAFLALRTGEPLAFFHAQRAVFDQVLVWPWQGMRAALSSVFGAPALSRTQVRDALDLTAVLFVLGVTAWVALVKRTQPLHLTLYVCAIVALATAAPQAGAGLEPYAGGGRYMLAALPVWLTLGAWCARRPWLREAWMVCGLALQITLVLFEARGGWLI